MAKAKWNKSMFGLAFANKNAKHGFWRKLPKVSQHHVEVRNICCQTYGVIAYVFISFILSRIVSYVELLQESVTTIRAIICKTLL